MDPPEDTRIEPLLQFVERPVVRCPRLLIRHHRQAIVGERRVDDLFRVHQQKPLAHLDRQTLASALPFGHELHDLFQLRVDGRRVGIPFGINNTVFPEVVAGDNDRAAFFFLGTPAAGAGTGADSSAPFNGVWHGYIATTYDGGKSWFTVDATPNDPVQLGVVCTNGTTCPSGTRNLLDFNDITVARDGTVYAGYADGCITAACIAKGNDPAASHTRFDNDGASKATIIRQTGGRGLFKNK